MSAKDYISSVDLTTLLFRSHRVKGFNLRSDLSKPRASKDGVDLLVFDYGDLHRIELLVKPLTPSGRSPGEFNYQMIYNQKELFSQPKKVKGKNLIRLFLGYSRILDLFIAPSEQWFDNAVDQGSIFAKQSELELFTKEFEHSIVVEQYSKTDDGKEIFRGFFKPEMLLPYIQCIVNGDLDSKYLRPLKEFEATAREEIFLLNMSFETKEAESQKSDQQKASPEPTGNAQREHVSKRFILTGPPGTGKTFAAKELAFAGKNPIATKENTTVVQFHPSYSYPQFVEGIFPTTYFDGTVLYQVVDGVLMVKYRQANGTPAETIAIAKLHDNQVFFNLPIGTFARYSLTAHDALELRIDEVQVTITKVTDDCFVVDRSLVADLANRLTAQSENLKINFRRSDWGKHNVVLIVDEINRGNVPEIFGELLYSLAEDSDLPALPVRLQYSQTAFSWPANLSLIGTMNVSDRSTGELDQALRRRFRFVQVDPQPKRLGSIDNSFRPAAIVNLFEEDPFDIRGGDKFASCDFAVRCANKVLERSPTKLALLPTFSESLIKLNSLIGSEKFGVFDAREKLIGHSFYIKLARTFSEILLHNFSSGDTARLNDKAVCYDVSNRLMHAWRDLHLKELLPQVKSVLSHDPDQVDTLMKEWNEQMHTALSTFQEEEAANVAG